MATGYTQVIEDSATPISFRSFALRCAGAFGALISIRDNSLDSPLPEKIVPEPYYEKLLTEAKADLADLLARSDDEWRTVRAAEARRVADQNESYRMKHTEAIARYRDMRAAVVAWQPPTPEHDGMKTFMLEQIDSSARWIGDLYQSKLPTADLGQYKRQAIADASDRVTSRSKAVEEEFERARNRNEWLQALVRSLPP